MMFQDSEKFSLPELEEKVLGFWRTNHIFPSVERARKRGKKFVFFEGPPTANGRPGIHHVLARAFKDVILRYQTMRGKYVVRRAGWDTQGLPVELEVEKKLGLNSKKDIEKYGVAAFNMKCRESVWEYQDEWERLTERMGFWLDMEHPYITYENSYTESVWWILKELWRKQLLYKGYKVVPWCPRCGTALSSHELAQGYAETTDNSVYVKFRILPNQPVGNLMSDEHTYFLSWTTTPWTLPGNVALAVGESMRYVWTERRTERGTETLIYAKDSPLEKELGHVGREASGKDLTGVRYEPLFDVPAFRDNDKAYRVYAAPFVTTEEGTGIVHTAVMYGADDYELGVAAGLPQRHIVSPDGTFTADIPELAGLFVKSKQAEEKIIAYLKTTGALVKEAPYTHEYPFCWRCNTPVIYYARDSWFIAMSGLRDKLLAANKRIGWVPAATGSGRFGEWLSGVKDWALSRERYWGTPLPVWECASCKKREFIGGFAELSERLGGAKNEYVVMRHSESERNVSGVVNGAPAHRDIFPLTDEGRKQALSVAGKLQRERLVPDVILASDFLRTKETAEIVGTALGVDVGLDNRLREVNLGDLEGESATSYFAHFKNEHEKFSKKLPGESETLRDVAARANELFQELERTHRGKRILLVTHEDVAWMFEAVLSGWSEEQAVLDKEKRGYAYRPGEYRRVRALVLPHGQYGFADFHRPFIDEAKLRCECNGEMRRVPDVIDVWFDSGAVPYAEWHYPFEHKALIESGAQFPADYISEAVDQTRGWFYTLLAISVALGRGEPYRHVVSLGHILDASGRKMSKSRGNIVDPWDAFKKFGVDAIRWYFYTVNLPGEPKRFDEQEIMKVLRGPVMLLYNSFVFLRTYPAKQTAKTASRNVLDRWILARYGETVATATKALDAYEIGVAARAISELIDDLSRWYVRRSRSRFQKPQNADEHAHAYATLRTVLLGTSRLIAPFMPFFAEGLYRSLHEHGTDKKSSVHLENWPKRIPSDKKLVRDMARVRAIAQAGLAKRDEAGIKVRQPLASLTVRDATLRKERELLDIVKDEVNVKEIIFRKDAEADVVLDTNITHELREEGMLRELLRAVQDLRKDTGCKPGDAIRLAVASDAEEVKHVVEKSEASIKDSCIATFVTTLPKFDGEKIIHLMESDTTTVRISKV